MLALFLSAGLLTQPATDAMRWRLIGPFRAGRTVAVSGVPQQPGTFYMAPTDGGVWKSADYGRTWKPIFDGQDTGSVGALAVSPSDPNVVYVGSGEGLRRPDLSVGDGIYKTVDGGETWTHLGLRNGQQINGIAIDPQNPDIVFAAVLGNPYGPSKERGLYRTTDGGQTWACVLCKNDNATGAASVVIDPANPQIVYADLWASRNPPWRLGDILQLYNRGAVYKSTDGGTTWTQLHGGLPGKLGRVGLAVSKTDDNVLYAWVNTDTDCGIYRSADTGSTWTKMNSEDRICGRGDDFSGIAIDPTDPHIVYVANTTMYRSTDDGKTFTGIKGAPGGDDYHTIWIDPTNRNVILLGVDQGATLSVDYGKTWSTWYNQPTAQFYHVITDNRFPYRVFGGQQESGSAEVLSRSDDGSIWMRYWHPVGAEEYAYIAPDPLHPNIIYGAGAGDVTRYDERTHQTQHVSPIFSARRFRQGPYRYDRTTPLVFNRIDKRTLYLGANVIFATRDGGVHWKVISPDLTRKHPGVPPNIGPFKADPLSKEERGVVYSIGPSYVNANVIWAGTDDGLVWVTRDAGAHWTNVTPPSMGAWNKVTQIDPSHFDAQTAYVSVSRWRLNDMRPYIYRTHDFGKHWQRITSGLPDQPVNVVREDTVRRGLLFAGNERSVYYSTDDGAQWHSLQLNLPSTSIRDLVVHDNDIVAGTHGRSFWVLDDIEPLREKMTGNVQLFQPENAYRLRRDTWTDTPLPPEEPAGKNPPDGAIFDYYLPHDAHGALTLSIYDSAGKLVRAYSSTDKPVPIDPEIDVPTYWVQPSQIPSASAGLHRFVWNYRYTEPKAASYDYPISALPEDTPREPQGVLALPGTYTVKLEVNSHTFTRRFRLLMDPRIHISQAALREQFDLAQRIALMLDQTGSNKGLARVNSELAGLLDIVEGADAAPTPALIRAVDAIERQLHHSH